MRHFGTWITLVLLHDLAYLHDIMFTSTSVLNFQSFRWQGRIKKDSFVTNNNLLLLEKPNFVKGEQSCIPAIDDKKKYKNI